MTELQEIQNGLKPLFEKAEKENLWFFSPYQCLWFSPDELKAKQAKGQFNWGAVNWELRSPKYKLDTLKQIMETAKKEYEEFEQKLKKAGVV